MSAPSASLRDNDIKFLQEQQQRAAEALSRTEQERDEAIRVAKDYEDQYKRMQEELDLVLRQVVEVDNSSRGTRQELMHLDETIRVTAEHNRLLRESISCEERGLSEANDSGRQLQAEEQRLIRVVADLEGLEKTSHETIFAMEAETSKLRDDWMRVTAEHEQLAQGILNLQSHTKSELDSIEETLKLERKRNTELLIQQRHNEIAEKKIHADIESLKIRQGEEQRELLKLQAILEGSGADSESIARQKAELISKIDEKRALHTRTKSLISDAELQVNKLRETFETTGRSLRESAGNVYVLADQLRILQITRKRNIEENTEKRKNVDTLEKQIINLNAKLSLETDAHAASVGEQRKQEQLVALLRKKYKQLEEALSLAISNQEKVEREFNDAKDRNITLTTQNTYMSNRIEAIEEEQATIRQEMKKVDSEIASFVLQRTQLETTISSHQDALHVLEADVAKIQADLDYIRREDLLDDTGRIRPLLIESDSDSSGLVDKLRINDFLVKAQREPKHAVPMLIEKIAQLLELIHTAQSQADQYLVDLSRSNTYVTTLRDKNRIVTDDVGTLENFRCQALIQMIINSIMNGGRPNLYLSGLGYGKPELDEFIKILRENPDVASRIEKISLKNNKLSDESIDSLFSIVEACGYLRELDLRDNGFSSSELVDFATKLRQMDGITGASKDDKRILASSGAQIRITVLIEGNKPKRDDLPIENLQNSLNN